MMKKKKAWIQHPGSGELLVQYPSWQLCCCYLDLDTP